MSTLLPFEGEGGPITVSWRASEGNIMVLYESNRERSWLLNYLDACKPSHDMNLIHRPGINPFKLSLQVLSRWSPLHRALRAMKLRENTPKSSSKPLQTASWCWSPSWAKLEIWCRSLKMVVIMSLNVSGPDRSRPHCQRLLLYYHPLSKTCDQTS